ncbi:MAG: MFS transporter [Caldilineaceae bacterium]
METQVAGWRRLAVRRLLQLDAPVYERSEEELHAEMVANYRWNFLVNLGDGALFWFGLSFISTTTILPLFVSKLTTSPFWLALLAVLGQASWYLPQIFTSGTIERFARKKPFVVNVGIFTERLPIWLLPLAALAAWQSRMLALGLFFVAYAWYGFGAGVIAPAWSDLIARCFPVERRGRFFGFTSFVGTGLGAIGAIFSGWLLETYPFPVNFAYCFLIAAVSVALSWFFIALTREPVTRASSTEAQPAAHTRRKIRQILRGDGNFRRFLWARLLSTMGTMGAGFLTVAAVERWQLADSTVGIFTTALLIGQTVGNLLAGLLADRFGHKLALELGLVAAIAAYTLAWWAPNPAWYYPLFFILGVANGISIVSGVLIALEFSLPKHRPTYIGITNTTVGIGNALGPIIGGLIASVSYTWLFATAALVGVAAFSIMFFAVQEPRRLHTYFAVDEVATEV